MRFNLQTVCFPLMLSPALTLCTVLYLIWVRGRSVAHNLTPLTGVLNSDWLEIRKAYQISIALVRMKFKQTWPPKDLIG